MNINPYDPKIPYKAKYEARQFILCVLRGEDASTFADEKAATIAKRWSAAPWLLLEMTQKRLEMVYSCSRAACLIYDQLEIHHTTLFQH